LTFETPFVLRTSDGKDGSMYSLNNKVASQRDGISLNISATKGEMYMQVEKEGGTKGAGLHYGDDGLNLHVVDSNRVRKSLNHMLTHIVKPKSDATGGMVTCGVKGSALTFSFQRVLDAAGKPQTETRKYIKNPQARRSSMDALSPAKMDELGRADRIDSSEFSDVDAMSRSSSVAGINSNPASPRAGAAPNALATPVDAAAVAARLPAAKDVEGPETEATASTSSASAGSSAESPSTPPNNSSAETKAHEAAPAATPAVEAKTPAPAASPVKTAAPAASPTKTQQTKPEPVKVEAAKVETPKPEAVKAEPAKATPEPKTTTTATAPPAPTIAAKAAPGEPKTVIADAFTFPPTPAIYGPAPAPVVASPKASTTPKSSSKAATPTAKPLSLKMKEEEVAQLKAEAEVENLEPACGAKCSVM
jgi:hypothetical protein